MKYFYLNWFDCMKDNMTRHLKAKIKRDELVLEVGSGHHPNIRSDVLCDKFLFDSRERNLVPLFIDRPMVIGDAEELPFKDKSFDFVYNAFLAEHLLYPEKFCKELMRVGKRGIIICPSKYLEIMPFGKTEGHKWLITTKGDEIIFEEKAEPRGKESKEFMDSVTPEEWQKCWRFEYMLNDKFVIYFHWKGKFKCKVKRISKPEELKQKGFDVSELMDKTNAEKGELEWSNELFKWFTKMSRLFKKDVDIYKLIACPICKGELKNLICNKCSVKYPIYGNIPILLREKAVSV